MRSQQVVLAADFDNTLGFLELFNTNIPLEELVNVDYVVRRKLNIQVTKLAMKGIEVLNRQQKFILVTTRSKQQFERITFSNMLSYAIYDNGGTIKINGVEDAKWTDHIDSQVKNLKYLPEQLVELVTQQLVGKYERVDKFKNFSIFYINPQNIDQTKELENNLQYEGYETSIQGNKLYHIPQCMTKVAGLEYLSERMNWDKIVAAGDSKPDISMMKSKLVNDSFVSCWGEIVENIDFLPLQHQIFPKIENQGAITGEQIINQFINTYLDQDLASLI
jgi:Sucrose-6F-phosphate phosphohydrolase